MMNRNRATKLQFVSTTTPPKTEWITVAAGKYITASIMFVSVLVVILLPIHIISKMNINQRQSSFKNNFKLWVGRLSCFAAGVFLSTGFMDIFPDVIESIEEAGQKLNLKITFPLASFFTLLGFFMILSIEQLIFIYNERGKQLNNMHQKDEQIADSTQLLVDNNSDIIENSSCNSRLNGLSKGANEMIDSSSILDHDHDHDRNHNHVNEDDGHNSILHHSKSRIITLMSAISVHAVFEGFAIGLDKSVAGVLQLFLALSLHKLIIAGSLGLNLATADLAGWFKIVVSVIFALGSPLGILAGIAVMQFEANGNKTFFMIGAALEGVACGTFLYVVFFEILPHEMGHHCKDDRFGKLTGLVLGFILVCLYLLFV